MSNWPKDKTEIALLILSLVLAFTAGVGAGYLIRGEQARNPILIDRAGGPGK
ncbi:MAG: hypothetical protein AAB389_03230 [Patescibacteria group bacterium]